MERVPRPAGRDPRKPLPARDLMVAEGDSRPEPGPLPGGEVTFEVKGEGWIARVTGASRSGTGPRGGAPLVLVGFAKAEAPERVLREAWAVGASLDEIGPVEALHRHAAQARSESGPARRGKGTKRAPRGRRRSRGRRRKKPRR